MAQRLGDAYWLHVVENAASRPTLHTTQNPARLPTESVLGGVEVVIQQWKGSERHDP